MPSFLEQNIENVEQNIVFSEWFTLGGILVAIIILARYCNLLASRKKHSMNDRAGFDEKIKNESIALATTRAN